MIGILQWRLGTELPPDFNEKLPNGQPFPSGTAYEILTAIEKRQKGEKLPDIYVFRFAGSSPLRLSRSDKVANNYKPCCNANSGLRRSALVIRFANQ